MPDLRLGNVFQLLSRRISRRWTRTGTNLVIFLGALCAQTNLFWREMKIKKMYLRSNTRQENFRTFEERDILNGINWDKLPAEKTSVRGMVLSVKSLCFLSCRQCADNRDTEKCQLSILSGVRIKRVNFRENI